ncbi:hypothetical protein ABEX38_30010 [Priestia megaterium]
MELVQLSVMINGIEVISNRMEKGKIYGYIDFLKVSTKRRGLSVVYVDFQSEGDQLLKVVCWVEHTRTLKKF